MKKVPKNIRDAYKASKALPAVYQIRNTVNGRIYIGSSSKPDVRFVFHLEALISGGHANYKLQADFLIHGKDCFVFEILWKNGVRRATLYKKEQEFIDKLKPFYNVMLKVKAVPKRFKKKPIKK